MFVFLFRLRKILASRAPDTGWRALRRAAEAAVADGPLVCGAIEPVGRNQMLTLSGDLDCASTDALAQAGRQLHHACTTSDAGVTGPRADDTPCHAFIDAADLHFIDAAGLGALIALRTRLADDGIEMSVVNAPRQLRRLSVVCNLSEMLGRQAGPGASTPRTVTEHVATA